MTNSHNGPFSSSAMTYKNYHNPLTTDNLLTNANRNVIKSLQTQRNQNSQDYGVEESSPYVRTENQRVVVS